MYTKQTRSWLGALPPEKLTVEVFTGANAECGDEAIFNFTEIRLMPEVP